METVGAIEVVLLLVFMVAGIYFLKDSLRFTFTKLITRVRSKLLLSLLFSFAAAFLSAFLDALTVVAVVITVATAFYGVYHRVASGKRSNDGEHEHANDSALSETTRADLDGFRSFLRSIVMHAAVGTALGGVTTLVGEPQNLLIGTVVGWDFLEFFARMAPVSLPVLVVGLGTCLALERLRWFGYGEELPANVRTVLEAYELQESEHRTVHERTSLIVQGIVAIFLVVALAFHWAPVGLIGLTVIVLATAFTGVTEEHRLGPRVPGSSPVHGAARRVLRHRRGHPRPAIVRAACCRRPGVAAGEPTGRLVRRERHTLGHQ